ncbi:MAG: hypothetical protein PSU93_06795 [Methylobacter sp.]|uniref:ApeA N-terminal domain-containing protein n=1 Tax=Candidatus Methylobacter titanis TaxID=3053457 RepID=A0AA43Q6U8_9GAMM|nr:hypothetical protein [Candidatus Methylobacter titanis]
MNLKAWKEETFELLLNNGRFQITDSGQLCSSINNFEVKRDDKQRLLLTTYCDPKSINGLLNPPELPAGTVHSITAGLTLSSSDMTVIAKSVIPFDQSSSYHVTKGREFTEKAWIGSLEYAPDDVEQIHQLIEWVNNVDTSLYFWPHKMEENIETIAIRTFSDGELNQRQHAKAWTKSFRNCLRLNIAGNEIYIAPFQNHKKERPSGPGFILYKKFPSDELRRKIRECLSFAFGLPLVYLGYTLLSKEFEFIGFQAVTPYIIDERIHAYQALPPAPVAIGSRHARIIDPDVFSKTVNALFAHYDELNFQHVSWIYWHAIFSPMHTQPVQLGGGIEALMAAYRKLDVSKYKTCLLDKENAKQLKDEFLEIVESMTLPDAEKDALRKKASGLNNPPQHILNERFFASLFLDMGGKEKKAWERRNDAAHGNVPKPDDSIELRRDIQLLKNTFHRIVISMTGASSQYIDCYSPKFPIRQLGETVEASDRLFFEG